MATHATGHELSPTTHTLEMTQVSDMNLRLANSRSLLITAAELGMARRSGPADHPGTLADSALLARVSWEGSPGFPTLHGHFDDQSRFVSASLHTAALREVSRRLHLRQHWGI